MKRENGYYWVQLSYNKQWIIAKYDPEFDCWRTIINNLIQWDKDFSVINETKLQPPC